MCTGFLFGKVRALFEFSLLHLIILFFFFSTAVHKNMEIKTPQWETCLCNDFISLILLLFPQTSYFSAYYLLYICLQNSLVYCVHHQSYENADTMLCFLRIVTLSPKYSLEDPFKTSLCSCFLVYEDSF